MFPNQIDQKLLPISIGTVVLTPALHLLLKLIYVFNEDDKILQNQNLILNSEEAIFERTPQLVLQIYIALHNFIVFEKPLEWIQWYSLTSASLFLTVPLIERFLYERR